MEVTQITSLWNILASKPDYSGFSQFWLVCPMAFVLCAFVVLYILQRMIKCPTFWCTSFSRLIFTRDWVEYCRLYCITAMDGIRFILVLYRDSLCLTDASPKWHINTIRHHIHQHRLSPLVQCSFFRCLFQYTDIPHYFAIASQIVQPMFHLNHCDN